MVSRAWLSPSRVYLLKHVSLTADNESFVSSILSLSPYICTYVKNLDIRRFKWCGTCIPSRISLLSHLAEKVTEIHVEDVLFDDFQHMLDLISCFPSLKVLSLLRVTWDVDTVTSKSLPISTTPRTPAKLKLKGLPATLSTLRAYHVNIKTVVDWLFMHPKTPQIPHLAWGPIEQNYIIPSANYIAQLGPDLKNYSTLLPPEGAPYAPYAYYSAPTGILEEPESMKHLIKQHVALYGVRPSTILRSVTHIHSIHFHRFLCDAIERNQTGSFWAPKTLTAFSAANLMRWIILDVELNMVSEVDKQQIPWIYLDDVLESEVYSNLECVLFRVLTDVNIVALENLLSARLPMTYERGIMKFVKVPRSSRYHDVLPLISSC